MIAEVVDCAAYKILIKCYRRYTYTLDETVPPVSFAVSPVIDVETWIPCVYPLLKIWVLKSLSFVISILFLVSLYSPSCKARVVLQEPATMMMTARQIYFRMDLMLKIYLANLS